MTTRGGVTRTCYTKIMNLFSSKILVQPFTGHVFFFFSFYFFFCLFCYYYFFFTLLILFFFLFYFSFNHLLLALYLFSSFISYVFIYLFFSYLFYFFILIYLVIFSFLYSHCHRSQTSQVMPCWRLPTTLLHAMHRSDILNFHREYSKMYDAERISTTYIHSNRYLKRKKNGQKIINLKIPECH